LTITAKCRKCGGSAIADTFEQARKKINHAVGLSRGIKCGDNYNCVTEIKPKVASVAKKITTNTKSSFTPKSVSTIISNDTSSNTSYDTSNETTTKTTKSFTYKPKSKKTKSSF